MSNIELSRPQFEFVNSDKKYSAFVAGYGSGKTFVGCQKTCIHFCKFPKINSGYFAPTYTDVRDIFYPSIEEVAYLNGFDVSIKVGNKEVEFYRGKTYYGTCMCRSMNNPSSIVGFKIGHALVDELDVLPMNKADIAWRKIVARMRYNVSGLRNSIDVTTTPEGFKFTYNKFVANKTESYGVIHASTKTNKANLPEDYYNSLLETYPTAVQDAYLEGLFVNMTSGSVYGAFNRQVNSSDETMQDKEPISIGQDFNVCNMTSCIFVKRENGYHAVDQLTGIYDTPALIRTLKEKYPERHITIYPDASGKNRHSSNASESDLSLLRAAGFSVKVNSRNPFVKDRVLSVNKAFEAEKVYINIKKCKTIAEAIEKQAYDDNGEPDKKTGFDHPADAFGYFIAYEMPVMKPAFITNIRV